MIMAENHDPVAADSYPRQPTASEKAALLESFPQLDFANVWITAPQTRVYNCIAWSLGIDTKWINPPQPLSKFIDFYRGYGYPVDYQNRVVDGWGLLITTMTHGSKVYTGVSVGVSGLWESKLGASFRITHAEAGLGGPVYGSILISFGASPGMRRGSEDMKGKVPMLSHNEAESIRELARQVAEETRRTYEKAFADWKRTWFSGPTLFSSDTRDLALCPEFGILASMGEEIIPLVLESLLQAENFPALVLYDTIQGKRELTVAPEEIAPEEGEQDRAVRAIQRWLEKR